MIGRAALAEPIEGLHRAHTMEDKNWLDRPVTLGRSAGGVLAFRSPWDGVLHGDVAPWPPPELVQKLYQSRQSRAFREEHL